MSTDIKLSKAQISKIIQSGGVLGPLLSKLAGPFMKVAVPLVKNISGENTWSWKNNFNNFKWRNEWHFENCSISWRF